MANQMNTRPEASWKQISCCFSFPSPLLSFHEAPWDSEGEWDTPLVFDMRREENGSHAGFKTFPETSGLSQEGLSAEPSLWGRPGSSGSPAVPCVVWCRCSIG